MAETAPRVPRATVVPVSARVTGAHVYPTVARNKVLRVRKDRPALISEARGKGKQTVAAPGVVLAHADQSQAIPRSTETAASQFVFMMQTTHYDEQGSAIVRLSVWRVTFDGENRQTVHQETIVRLL